MKHLKEGDFAERRKSAAAAKELLLEKLRKAPNPDDPEVAAKRAKNAAVAAAAEARRAERNQIKRAAAEREAAEAAATAAAQAAIRQSEIEMEKARAGAEELDGKAERDRRYAARKARKR